MPDGRVAPVIIGNNFADDMERAAVSAVEGSLSEYISYCSDCEVKGFRLISIVFKATVQTGRPPAVKNSCAPDKIAETVGVMARTMATRIMRGRAPADPDPTSAQKFDLALDRIQTGAGRGKGVADAIGALRGMVTAFGGALNGGGGAGGAAGGGMGAVIKQVMSNPAIGQMVGGFAQQIGGGGGNGAAAPDLSNIDLSTLDIGGLLKSDMGAQIINQVGGLLGVPDLDPNDIAEALSGEEGASVLSDALSTLGASGE